MKRVVFTLLVSLSSFAAIASFGAADAPSDESSLDRAEVVSRYRATGWPPGQPRSSQETKTAPWSLPANPDTRRIVLEQAAT